MSDPYSLRPIPGPDRGACPECGGWLRAGMAHDCERERARQAEESQKLVDAYNAVSPSSSSAGGPDRSDG